MSKEAVTPLGQDLLTPLPGDLLGAGGVNVVVHTDSQGSGGYNLSSSQARADIAKA